MTPSSSRVGYVCASCLSSSRACLVPLRPASSSYCSRSLSTSTSPPPSPPALPSKGHTLLSRRALIQVHGPAAALFLNGLITSTLRSGSRTGQYGAFLNAQGRVLHDVFVYPASHSSQYRDTLVPEAWSRKYGDGNDGGWLVECDAATAPALLRHLKRHKLRAQLDVRALDEGEWQVWSAWDDQGQGRWTSHPSPSSPSPSASSSPAESEGAIGTLDARAPGLGRRLVLPAGMTPPQQLEQDVGDRADLTAYDMRRWTRGVPEGQDEIPYGAALPQEHNIDFMAGGVDFKKGCYIGQELTIRTHHTGIVRKRILPCVLYQRKHRRAKGEEDDSGGDLASLVAKGENVMPADGRRGRSAGKWVAGAGDVGIGLCRIEMVSDVVLTAGEDSRYRESDEFEVAAGRCGGKVTEGEGGEGGEGEGGGEAKGRKLRVKAFVPDWIRGQIKAKTPNTRV